jgi:hypothetical protein
MLSFCIEIISSTMLDTAIELKPNLSSPIKTSPDSFIKIVLKIGVPMLSISS